MKPSIAVRYTFIEILETHFVISIYIYIIQCIDIIYSHWWIAESREPRCSPNFCFISIGSRFKLTCSTCSIYSFYWSESCVLSTLTSKCLSEFMWPICVLPCRFAAASCRTFVLDSIRLKFGHCAIQWHNINRPKQYFPVQGISIWIHKRTFQITCSYNSIEL